MPITNEERQRFIKASLDEFEHLFKGAKNPTQKLYAETLRALFHVSEGLSWDCSTREDYKSIAHSGVMLTYTKAMAHSISMVVGDQCKPGLEEVLASVLAEQFKNELIKAIVQINEHMNDAIRP